MRYSFDQTQPKFFPKVWGRNREVTVSGGLALSLALTACGPTGPPPPISTQAGVVATLETGDADPQRRDALVAAGARSYRAMGCVTCHAMDATPMTGPGLHRLYENPVELAFTSDVDARGTPVGEPTRHADPVWRERDRAYLWRSIAHPSADVVAGYTGAQRMTHFGHLMDDEEVAGLIAYLEANTRELGTTPKGEDQTE
ncbi:MAG: c-type cytochrome [Planctomycetota bacterium]